MNGSVKLVISVLSFFCVLMLTIIGFQTAAIAAADTSAAIAQVKADKAWDLASRNEERGKTEYREIIRRLDCIDQAVGKLN